MDHIDFSQITKNHDILILLNLGGRGTHVKEIKNIGCNMLVVE
jgi:hypothetical protein